jgi:hypothetical protein
MSMTRVDGPIRVGTPQNLWGADGADMPLYVLPGVPERAFCILYLHPAADWQSVLTAIFTRDKLGYAEVALLLPDPNRALGRQLDFVAFSSLRGKLRARLAIIAWSPRLALLATWRHFPVDLTVKDYAAHFAGQPLPGPRQQWWLIALLRAARRYALVRWLGRTPEQAARARTSPRS